MIVVDASVIAEYLITGPRFSAAASVLMRGGAQAPHLLDAEVAHALRRAAARGALSQAEAEESLGMFADMLIRRHPHRRLLPRVWELRRNFSAYDALYVSLAEALGAPLVTVDRRLKNASGHQAIIELI